MVLHIFQQNVKSKHRNSIIINYKSLNFMKKLTRSSNKKIMGVAAGVAEYLNIDPTIMRIIWAVSVIFCGFGLLAYIICIFLMPEK